MQRQYQKCVMYSKWEDHDKDQVSRKFEKLTEIVPEFCKEIENHFLLSMM